MSDVAKYAGIQPVALEALKELIDVKVEDTQEHERVVIELTARGWKIISLQLGEAIEKNNAKG